MAGTLHALDRPRAVILLAILGVLCVSVPRAAAAVPTINILEGPEDGAVVAGEMNLVLWATSSDPLSEVTLTVQPKDGPVTTPLRWTYDSQRKVLNDVVAATVKTSRTAMYEIIATARSRSATRSTMRTVTLLGSGPPIITGDPVITLKKIDPPSSVTLTGSPTTTPTSGPPPAVDTPATTAPGGDAPSGVVPTTSAPNPSPSGAGGPGGGSLTPTPPTSASAAGIVADPAANRDGGGGMSPALLGGGLILLLLTGAATAVLMRRPR